MPLGLEYKIPFAERDRREKIGDSKCPLTLDIGMPFGGMDRERTLEILNANKLGVLDGPLLERKPKNCHYQMPLVLG